MQIKNNYDVPLAGRKQLQGGTGIFNGDVGIIHRHHPGGDGDHQSI